MDVGACTLVPGSCPSVSEGCGSVQDNLKAVCTFNIVLYVL